MRYLFEDFCLDTERRELSRAGGLVRLEPQAFDLLEYLVRNRERLVTRDDLIASVWGGRIVSDSALATRINAARSALGDSGEQQRLIKTIPRKGLRFVGRVREQATDAPPLHVPPPDQPSIAVLPFANLSGDAGQDYFVDGVVEGIIAGLCRMRWLFVIARGSSFAYKGRAIGVSQVGRELGVRYVLEGSVLRAADRVRVSVRLVEAATGTHIAADHFDGCLGDIFALQDEMTANVVGALSPRLEWSEIVRAARKPTDSLDAYDLYLRGLAAIYRWTRDSHEEALRLFMRAIDADPDFAAAYGLAARCYNWRAVHGWMADREREIVEGLRLARCAAALGREDAGALAMAGHAMALLGGDIEAGCDLMERALAIDPNLAAAWLSGGWTRVWRGEPDLGVAHFARAMRLSPLDPNMFNMQAGTATAHLLSGRHEEALRWAERALLGHPTFGPALRVAAACHAIAGRSREASRVVLRLRDADPGLRISGLTSRVPWKLRSHAGFVEALRLAGVPE